MRKIVTICLFTSLTLLLTACGEGNRHIANRPNPQRTHTASSAMGNFIPGKYQLCVAADDAKECLKTRETIGDILVFNQDNIGYYDSLGNGGYGNSFKWQKAGQLVVLLFQKYKPSLSKVYYTPVFEPGSKGYVSIHSDGLISLENEDNSWGFYYLLDSMRK